MLNFMLFLFASVGISNIIVNSYIFEGLRETILLKNDFFGKMINCMLCTGFWIGIILWTANPIIFSQFGILAPIAAGAISSLASSFYDIVTDYLIVEVEHTDEE